LGVACSTSQRRWPPDCKGRLSVNNRINMSNSSLSMNMVKNMCSKKWTEQISLEGMTNFSDKYHFCRNEKFIIIIYNEYILNCVQFWKHILNICCILLTLNSHIITCINQSYSK
jgi:hypothetical protein